jgi:hypothetical protein
MSATDHMTALDLVVGAQPKLRQRKPSLVATIKRLLRAGIAATSATLAPDGSVSVVLGERAAQPTGGGGNELEEWIAKHADKAKRS